MKIPKIADGCDRAWYECKQCGHVCYRDYVPYSFSNPIITLPCGHFSPEQDNGLRQITADQALIKLTKGRMSNPLNPFGEAYA